LPVKMQEKDAARPELRPAAVYLIRIKDGLSTQKVAPYILHQIITAMDAQAEGEHERGQAVLRSVFAVYCEDGEEGSLMLLNLMERLRIAFLKQRVINGQFQLDLTGEGGLESLIYPDDTMPYYLGEMVSTWRMPGVQREVTI